MTIGVLITARNGSTRLQNKHFRKVGDRPALSWLIDRIISEFKTEIEKGLAKIYVATGNAELNTSFLELVRDTSVKVYFGDDLNVPLRHLQTAEVENLSGIVSVDGDDILCAPEAMRRVFERLLNGDGLVKTTGLPLGMNAWGYSRDVLAKALVDMNSSLLETGWGRIFDKFTPEVINFSCRDSFLVRATLDYPDDLKFFDQVVNGISNWHMLSSNELVSQIVNNNFHKTNFFLSQQYWDNFNLQISNEKGSA
jgi:spore coat polysaccharide biosynthesis protein SpsF (cytidylyltransferase family)